MENFKELFTEESENLLENGIPENVDKEVVKETIKSLKLIRRQEKKALAVLDVLDDLYYDHNRTIEKTMGAMRGPKGNQRFKAQELIKDINRANSFYDKILAKYGKKA